MAWSNQLTSGAFIINNVPPAPTISSCSPNEGLVLGGTFVTVSGTNFQNSEPGASITFGGDSATEVTFVSSTTLTCRTPAHAVGIVDVVVINPDLQSGTKVNGFTYYVVTITSCSPHKGLVGGGTLVTIKGTHFQSGIIARFGDVTATENVFVNSTTMACRTPAHVAEIVDVVIINTDLETATKVNGFTYYTTVVNVSAQSSDDSVTLEWTNPLEFDFVTVVRKEGSCSEDPSDGEVLYTGTDSSYVDSDLDHEKVYYYRIFTFSNGIWASSDCIEAMKGSIATVIFSKDVTGLNELKMVDLNDGLPLTVNNKGALKAFWFYNADASDVGPSGPLYNGTSWRHFNVDNVRFYLSGQDKDAILEWGTKGRNNPETNTGIFLSQSNVAIPSESTGYSVFAAGDGSSSDTAKPGEHSMGFSTFYQGEIAGKTHGFHLIIHPPATAVASTYYFTLVAEYDVAFGGGTQTVELGLTLTTEATISPVPFCRRYDFIQAMLDDLTSDIYDIDAKVKFEKQGIITNLYAIFAGFDKGLHDVYEENLRTQTDNYISRLVENEAVTKGPKNSCDCLANVNVFEIIKVGDLPNAEDYFENIDFILSNDRICWTQLPMGYYFNYYGTAGYYGYIPSTGTFDITEWREQLNDNNAFWLVVDYLRYIIHDPHPYGDNPAELIGGWFDHAYKYDRFNPNRTRFSFEGELVLGERGNEDPGAYAIVGVTMLKAYKQSEAEGTLNEVYLNKAMHVANYLIDSINRFRSKYTGAGSGYGVGIYTNEQTQGPEPLTILQSNARAIWLFSEFVNIFPDHTMSTVYLQAAENIVSFLISNFYRDPLDHTKGFIYGIDQTGAIISSERYMDAHSELLHALSLLNSISETDYSTYINDLVTTIKDAQLTPSSITNPTYGGIPYRPDTDDRTGEARLGFAFVGLGEAGGSEASIISSKLLTFLNKQERLPGLYCNCPLEALQVGADKFLSVYDNAKVSLGFYVQEKKNRVYQIHKWMRDRINFDGTFGDSTEGSSITAGRVEEIAFAGLSFFNTALGYIESEPAQGATYYVTYRYGTRDERLYDIWGRLISFDRLASETYTQYRDAIRSLFKVYLEGPTLKGIKLAVSTFTGADPDITEFYNTYWILGDPTYYLGENIYLGGIADDFTFEVAVNNPNMVEINHDVIERVVRTVKPAHTRAVFSYPDE